MSVEIKPHVSFSQVSSHCGWQLRYKRLVAEHREGAHAEERVWRCPLCGTWEPPPDSIRTVFGTAVHEGIERFLSLAPRRTGLALRGARVEAVKRARAYLEGAALGELTWDEEPRRKRNGELYKGDGARVPDLETGLAMAEAMVESWIDRFGDIEAAGLERRFDLDLSPWGLDWTVTGFIDVMTLEGGVVDIKTAREPWTPEKWGEKLDQAWIYSQGYEQITGQPPEYVTFHVGVKGENRWQVVEADLDGDRFGEVLEDLIRPTIKVIEADAYTPNRGGWWCSEACDFWTFCPLGAAAAGRGREVGT